MTAFSVSTGVIESDAFTRNVSNDWGDATFEYAGPGDPWFRAFGSAGALNVANPLGTLTMAGASTGGGAQINVGDPDHEHVFEFKITGSLPSSGEYYQIYQMVRYTDGDNWYASVLTIYDTGQLIFQLVKSVNATQTALAPIQILTSNGYHLNDLFWMRTTAIDQIVQGKAWFNGATEPAWLSSVVDSSLTTGHNCTIRALSSSGNSHTGVASFTSQAGNEVVAGYVDSITCVQVPNRDSVQIRDQLLTPEVMFGVHQDLCYDGFSWRRQAGIDVATALGATISRNSLPWYTIEATEGVQDWSKADGAISELHDANLQIVAPLVGSPQWVNGDADPFVVPTDPGDFADFCTAWADFASQCVNRYPYIKRWEIWNEEEDTNFWKNTPDPYAYAQLYTAMRDAILLADPEAMVAVGGLTSLQEGGGTYTGVTFLESLMSQSLPLDYVAIHPYCDPAGPTEEIPFEPSFLDDILAIRNALDNNNYAGTKIWVTEYGWADVTNAAAVGTALQAQYATEAIQIVDQDYPYVELSTYFLDRDTSDDLYHYGLYYKSVEGVDPSAKPAADSWRDAAAAAFKFDSVDVTLIGPAQPPDRRYRTLVYLSPDTSPEGVLAANPGVTVVTTAGHVYVKQTGKGSTGWVMTQ